MQKDSEKEEKMVFIDLCLSLNNSFASHQIDAAIV